MDQPNLLPSTWHQLATDLLRTTGHVLALTVENHREWGESAGVFLDGRPFGTTSRDWSNDPTVRLVEIIDNLQETWLHEYIWGGWPTCPQHHTHPLEPAAINGTACWICPFNHDVVAPLGGLASGQQAPPTSTTSSAAPQRAPRVSPKAAT